MQAGHVMECVCAQELNDPIEYLVCGHMFHAKCINMVIVEGG
jgi:hypothetical protein